MTSTTQPPETETNEPHEDRPSPRTHPRWWGALAGLVAALAALGAAEAVAAFSKTFQSPVLDVGDRVVDTVPNSVKELAIRWFGTNDKVALLTGIGAILAVYAALVGVIAFGRRLWWALAGIGAFADALPKGKVMFVSNAIKVVGCLMMAFGTHPLLSYAIVGLGAAAYSPAKYGILTELLPPSQLVKANGWIEGLTIASIILGVLLGGQLVGQAISPMLLRFDFPLIDTGIDTAPEAAISVLIFVYLLAAWFRSLVVTLTSLPPVPGPRCPGRCRSTRPRHPGTAGRVRRTPPVPCR